MLHKTKGIVLRTVKYGETSVIVSIFTELFGIQSYIVNGVRTTSKKGSSKGSMFQASSMLDMVVYHNEMKNLQRISEYKWGYLYQHIFSDIRKNAVAMFMVELLAKCLKQPEANGDLYDFIEDAFIHLDESSDEVMANFPLFFALHLAVFFGFRIDDNYSSKKNFLDLIEGNFAETQPVHTFFLADKQAFTTSQLLKIMQPEELKELRLNHSSRRELLQSYENYYALHIQDFGTLKSLPILKEVLE
ncbi:MAG TPA: DNA repair protein RecO [Chitinophagaceae bacterium]|jgi:DNA repair protein RecO